MTLTLVVVFDPSIPLPSSGNFRTFFLYLFHIAMAMSSMYINYRDFLGDVSVVYKLNNMGKSTEPSERPLFRVFVRLSFSARVIVNV